MNIGKRIREFRQLRDMTLRELSRNTGVQIATLSRIENGKMTGTLESHISIARALGITLNDLYADVVRKASAVELQEEDTGADVFIHSDKSSYEILTSKVLSKKMMPILLKIEPGGQTNPEQNRPGTEKFLYILEGTVEAHIDKDAYTLKPFSSLYFDAALRHHFVNKGKVTARMICVATPVAL